MTRQMKMALANDRLSDLPDNLLSHEILPKISFRNAVRCSVLSRRWRFLWKEMPQLHFCCQDFEKQKEDEIQAIIENALIQNKSATLHSFQLQIALTSTYNNLIKLDLWVHSWVQLAAQKSVKRIALEFSDRDSKIAKKFNSSLMFQLGYSVFEGCHYLEALKLKCCSLPNIPSNFGGFQFLKACYWYDIWDLNDAIFQQLMDLCPNLQSLGVHACGKLRNFKISAPNLQNLVVHDCHLLGNLKISAPKLGFLDVGFFRSATSFEVVSHHLTEIKLQQSATTQGLQLLEGLSRGESVKKITLLNRDGANQDVPSVSVLDSFPSLQELTIHGQCFEEMISVNKVPEGVTLENLKKVHVHIVPEMDEKVVTLLGFLLRNCSLNAMRIFLPPRCSKIIQKKLLDLKKEFPESKIFIDRI
ncbi:hypothetical protein KI387_025138 [Taxus chinensis]|uniref:At1g61320/AtMIF1 LRR domain-containing protein n=1 Tax=Taxus chinensis TaxID=29808 RepID=A0AA38G4N6_TAXCH|nr:hypothetical protein KI387_025138 [Taxus chinensis]